MVDNNFGRVIPTTGKSESQLLSDLVAALIQFAENPLHRQELGIKAEQKVQEFSWSKSVARVYTESSRSDNFKIDNRVIKL